MPCTCVGLQPTTGPCARRLYAPNGLDDLYAGILRPTPLCDYRDLFRQKALGYRARWPWLEIRES